MGCFNGTCFLSNLPLRYGDPMVVFITAANDAQSNNEKIRAYNHTRTRSYYVYPADNEEPVSLPIRGEYNDYGSIENYDKDSLAVRMAEHVMGTSFEDGISGIMDRREADPVSIGPQKCSAGFFMAHGLVYDKLMERYLPGVKEDALAIDLKQQFEAREEAQRLRKKGKLSGEENKLLKDADELLEKAFSMSLMSHEYKFSCVQFKQMLHEVWKKTKGKKKRAALFDEYYKLRKELTALNSAMMILRKSWTQPCGAGAQHYCLKDHLAFADIVKESAIESFKDPEDLYNHMMSSDW